MRAILHVSARGRCTCTPFRGFFSPDPVTQDSQLAPHTRGFNAYNARIEYVDGEVTITFVPVDMPGMPDAAREYRNRAVTIRHCPVEPHHVGQRCGEPVFEESFAFVGSPSRTLMLPDCAGWLVVEAAELSDDRYDGWRNAPLSCRTDEAGRTVTSVDTDGNGPGWEDSRFDPPVRAEPEPEPEPEPVDTRPVWILLADSLTAQRNLGNTGRGPDAGSWPLRWVRWYYNPADPAWTIVQFYSEGSWAYGGTGHTGCRVDSDANGGSKEWNAYLTMSGAVSTSGVDSELLTGDTSDAFIRRLDAPLPAGNDIPRVPDTGEYMDDSARLWTFRIQRTSAQTRITSQCNDNQNNSGQIYFMTVPLPPTTG